ncbi:MAG: hypothetical protein Q8L77_18345 [Nitrospirota bacterium]|nr:hypothetical protein [Nitrospirota bacterium]
MNWAQTITGILVLSSTPAWGATLNWTANSEPDLAGYRVYQCSRLPCTPVSGNASTLATVGTATSFNIGTPAVTQYYFITALDFSSNESGPSSLATYTPVGSPPPVALPVIGMSPTNLSFAATQGSANPASQTLTISNQGGGTLTWSATETAAWLAVSPASGTGNGAVTLTVTSGSLAAGTYNSTVTLQASGASSVTVPVTLTVATAPVPAAIGMSPTSLSFTATPGASPSPKTLNISNTGGGTLTWSASDNAPWLTLNRVSGTGNSVVTVTVMGNSTVGTYSGSITLSAIGASPVTVPVTLTVTAAAPPPVVPPPTPTAPPTPGGLSIIAVN